MLSICSSFNALSTDSIRVTIGVCCQELFFLEFNFHYPYSRHSVVSMSYVRLIVRIIFWKAVSGFVRTINSTAQTQISRLQTNTIIYCTCANLVMDALVGRTAVASQQLHQDGCPGHPVQHAHCCGLHPHVIRLNTSLQLRVCTSATYIYSTAARAKRAGGWVVPRTSGYTSLVPRPSPSFPSLAVPYCKRREAGRGPGNEAKGTQGWHKFTPFETVTS